MVAKFEIASLNSLRVMKTSINFWISLSVSIIHFHYTFSKRSVKFPGFTILCATLDIQHTTSNIKNMNKKTPENKGKIIIYKAKDNKISLNVRLEKETVWLTQEQMAELFQRDQSVVSRHINNVFKEGELSKKSNMHFLHIANSDKPVAFYNLDIIISIGYRVKSLRGTQFRIWATKILKNYLIKGYALNQKRLKETDLSEFEQAVNLIKKTIESKKLKSKETKGLLEVITGYANSWML